MILPYVSIWEVKTDYPVNNASNIFLKGNLDHKLGYTMLNMFLKLNCQLLLLGRKL